MKKTSIILAILTACLAMACSGPSKQEPSKENFTNVLNAYLQKEGITVDFTKTLPIEIEEWIDLPTSVRLGDIDIPFLRRPPVFRPTDKKIRCERLEQFGLLTSQETIVEKPYKPSPQVTQMVQCRIKKYDLSEKGKQFILAPDAAHTNYRLKIATAKVDKVDNFTSPTPIKGLTVSRVRYSYSPDQVQSWAKNGDMEESFPKIKDKLNGTRSETATLVLMGDGWKHGHEVAGDIMN